MKVDDRRRYRGEFAAISAVLLLKLATTLNRVPVCCRSSKPGCDLIVKHVGFAGIVRDNLASGSLKKARGVAGSSILVVFFLTKPASFPF